jgi:hypothetical protein
MWRIELSTDVSATSSAVGLCLRVRAQSYFAFIENYTLLNITRPIDFIGPK